MLQKKMGTINTTSKTPHTTRTSHTTTRNNKKTNVETAANDLLRDGKKLANELYKGSMNKVGDAEDSIQGYTDELLKKVQKNPLASVLIASGVGFVLSLLLKK
jgi:ElaB/YqjD/DUF883 family membrane-anchored ribosome-binding protein